MNPDRTAWGDSRLTDTFRRVDVRIDDVQNEIRANRDLPQAVVKIGEQLRYLTEKVDLCQKGQDRLGRRFDRYIELQDEAHEKHRLERKSDRRWLIGTGLTSATLVIGAVALLLAHLS